MLELKNIKGGYEPGNMVLQGINLKIASGEVVSVIGLNGCGKSTLVKAIMNMLPYRQGMVILNSVDLINLPMNRMKEMGIALVMQGGRIFPNMTIQEHLHLAGNTHNVKGLKKNLQTIDEQYGLVKFTKQLTLTCRGSYLSGGEKQQLALIMALLNEPKFLILDEISAGLSPKNISLIAEAIDNLKNQRKIGILLIEQNIKLATRLADRIILLERGIIDKEYKIDENFELSTLNNNIFI